MRRVGLVVVFGLVLMAAPGVAVGDLDDSGTADVVFANIDGIDSRVCLGNGVGGFTCNPLDIEFGPGARNVDAADLDGDGDTDLVFSTAGSQNRVCLGDDTGGFSCADLDPSADDSNGAAFGDVDGDGRIDVVVANNGSNRVCLGDGSGGFTCGDMGAGGVNTLGVDLGDVDRDGDLDAVLANYDALEGARNSVCLGDGAGGFDCTDVSSTLDSTTGVALGDVDRDGDLDALFSSHPNPNHGRSSVCLGDGSGGFACSDLGSISVFATRLALGDVDGDGDLDAVLPTGGGDWLCRGDGTGGFTCEVLDPAPIDTWEAGIVDIDRDGDLDVVFASIQGDRANRLCLGDGTGGFACSDLGAAADKSHGLAVVAGHRGTFVDDDFSPFESDIEWIAAEGVTQGCTADGTMFCPDDLVTRGQMAAFLARALGLPDGAVNTFVDDDGSIFEADIAKIAEAGITKGCNAEGTLFCPDDFVTRGQMAAFLVRALGFTDSGGGNLFTDDDGSIFEDDIDKLATAGVTKGCNPEGTLFCPDDFVTRGQMAAFLSRALG